MNFYVYSILDPRKPGSYKYGGLEFDYEPIYIGKGKKNRLNDHLKTRALRKNSFKNNKIKKILSENMKPIIIKLKENLSEQDSINLEKEYIALIKRYPEGPLTNLTDGGEGVSGLKHTKESLDKMSKTWFTNETAGWNRGMMMSEEHCKKLSDSHIGKPLSDDTKKNLSKIRRDIKKSSEHKRKISEGLTKKKYFVTYPDDHTQIITNYNEFCKENKLSVGSMSLVLNGKRTHYKNYKISCVA